ncbi:MAG: hypothetical protein WCO98_04550 [bacterium]
MTEGTDKKNIFKYSGSIFFLLTTAVIIGVVIYIINKKPVDVNNGTPPPNSTSVDLHLKTVKIHGVSNGKIVWQVEAANFDMTKSNTLSITGLKKIIMLNGATEEFTITAATLNRNLNSGDFGLEGGVKLIGKSIEMAAKSVLWNDYGQEMIIPSDLTAKVGDYNLSAPAGAIYKLTNKTLTCTGGITLTSGANSITAASATFDIIKDEMTLDNGVNISLSVNDISNWATGAPLPEIPPIPPGIKERYKEYQQKKGNK